MAEIQGVGGSTVRAPRPAASTAVGAVDTRGGSGGRGGGGATAVRGRDTDGQQNNIIRFEGRDLDRFAPRGTYLDIWV